MEQAIAFIKNFVRTDYKVRAEQWTEADDQLFQRDLNELNRFYVRGMASNIHRETPSDPKKLAEANGYLKTLQQKKIFQIKEYSHPHYDKLYCAYLSSDFAGGSSYFIKLYFTKINHEYKIISEYYICSDCEGTGIINNRKCNECDGSGWFWQGGAKISTTGKPVQTVRLLQPTNPVHLKEFQSE